MTITLEGDAAEILRRAADRAGYGDDVPAFVRRRLADPRAVEPNPYAGMTRGEEALARLKHAKTNGVTYEQIAEWNRSEV